MKTMLRWVGALALALMPSAALAQSIGSSVQFPAGWAPGTSVCVQQTDGKCAPVSATNPLPVTGGGGGGGGSVTQPDQYASGTIAAGTANAAYTVAIANGAGVAGFTVNGLTAAAATLAIETSNDKGTTWTPANGLQGSTGILFNTLTADGQFRVNTGGRTMVRLRVTSAGSGTVNVTSNLSVASTEIAMSSPLPPGTNTLGGVTNVTLAATSTALIGTSSAAQVVGPFTPQLGRTITIALTAATWPGGTAQILRSTDGGTTKLPLTPAGVLLGTYTQQGVDQPWLETEAGATFYLSLPAAGIGYRVSN